MQWHYTSQEQEACKSNLLWISCSPSHRRTDLIEAAKLYWMLAVSAQCLYLKGPNIQLWTYSEIVRCSQHSRMHFVHLCLDCKLRLLAQVLPVVISKAFWGCAVMIYALHTNGPLKSSQMSFSWVLTILGPHPISFPMLLAMHKPPAATITNCDRKVFGWP